MNTDQLRQADQRWKAAAWAVLEGEVAWRQGIISAEIFADLKLQERLAWELHVAALVSLNDQAVVRE